MLSHDRMAVLRDAPDGVVTLRGPGSPCSTAYVELVATVRSGSVRAA